MSDFAGQVHTVLGSIAPAAMGQTMMHEHLLLDISPPEARSHPGEVITLANCGHFRRYSHLNPFNLRLTNEAEAIDEMRDFKSAGGGTVVEATSIGLCRDPAGLRRIAQASGVHIIMGASYYVHNYHPSDVARMTEAQITDVIVRDITEGVNGTGIRAGLIGEVGLYWPMHVDEIKVLRASAQAQRQTGAPLMIHPGRDPRAPLEAMRIVREAGGDAQRTVMAHIDRTLFSLADMTALARTGCCLEFDLFGKESSYYPLAPIDMPNDAMRINALLELIAAGYRHQLVVAHDICYKTCLKKYGGDGYDHILRNVVPVMHRKGMTAADIEALLVHNPARLMTFV
jgi:phosphotriesterase-related protein